MKGSRYRLRLCNGPCWQLALAGRIGGPRVAGAPLRTGVRREESKAAPLA